MFTIRKFKAGWRTKSFWFLVLFAAFPAKARVASDESLRARALEFLSSTRALTLGSIAGGRLTTESGEPLSLSDRTAQSTIYYTPYNGSKITLYTGTNWQIFGFSELSIAVPAGSAGDMYDVFIYANSGTPTLELTAWTNSTTRAVSLTYFEGVRVKLGDATRRYLGSFSLSGSGITEDSNAARLVYNLLNQTERGLFKQDLSNSHSYNGFERAFNNDTNSKVDFVIGEQGVLSGFLGMGLNNPGAGAFQAYFQWGLSNFTTPYGIVSYTTGSYGQRIMPISAPIYNSGRYYVGIIENTANTGAVTFEYYNLIASLLM